MRQLQNQAASLEYENKDLTEKKHRYESTIQTLSEEKRLQTEEVNRIRRELERHREKNNFLGAGWVPMRTISNFSSSRIS